MRPLDRLLQEWRLAKVAPYIARDSRVLDIGCGDGRLFRRFRSRIREGIGIDPDLREPSDGGFYRLIPGVFPDHLPDGAAPFDVITMLAVLEHIPRERQRRLAEACAALLVPGGRLVITVPSPAVDRILHGLRRVPFFYEGRSLEQHYGFDVRDTPVIFSPLTLLTAKKFQCGLNHLFVFQRPA